MHLIWKEEGEGQKKAGKGDKRRFLFLVKTSIPPATFSRSIVKQLIKKDQFSLFLFISGEMTCFRTCLRVCPPFQFAQFVVVSHNPLLFFISAFLFRASAAAT